MGKIEQIKEAIEKAERGESKLTNELLELPAFNTAAIKHLLNNLGSISSNYLEIGLHKAGGFICALHGNDKTFGVGVDNWSQFEQDGLSRELAYRNTEQHLPSFQYVIREQDCFEPMFSEGDKGLFDLYTYDGDHSYDCQYKGIEHFLPYMKDEFILCVDDFSWEDPKRATEDAIKNNGLLVLFHEFIWDGKEGSKWHNGFGVYLLKKP